MWMWIRNLLLVGVVVLLAIPVWGEYYQYTDENGALRFTDYLAGVPQDQRPDVKTYESVKSDPVQPPTLVGPSKKISRASAPSPSGASQQTGTWNERISRQADELNRMQLELRKNNTTLQSERTELEEKVPPAWATAKEQDVYRWQVGALNARIDRYEEQRAEYMEKAKAFNAQYGK